VQGVLFEKYWNEVESLTGVNKIRQIMDSENKD
jgi:hypothetical protein